jgi:hypothetical protein
MMAKIKRLLKEKRPCMPEQEIHCRVQVKAGNATISWDLSVTLGLCVETKGLAHSCLVFFHLTGNLSFIVFNLLANSLLCALIAKITFVVDLSARAVITYDLSFELFTIIAFGVLASSYIRNLLTHKALIISVTTIIWGPKLVVRAFFTWFIYTLALRFVKIFEVHCDDDTFFSTCSLVCVLWY